MAAELALLVSFVYVPLAFGAIYVGWLAVARQRVHESNHYALSMFPYGDQLPTTADPSPPADPDIVADVSNTFFREYTGKAETRVGDADDADIPGPDEIHDIFEEFTELIYYHHVSAQGSFRLVGNTVVYQETIQESEGYHMRPEGQLVESLGLLEDNIPEHITGMLWWPWPDGSPEARYMRRRKAHTSYLHSWKEQDRDLDQETWAVRDDGTLRPWVEETDGGTVTRRFRTRYDDTGTDDSEVRAWNLKVPTDDAALRDLQEEGIYGWHPECAVRYWENTRMVGDQSPPGAIQREWVNGPVQDTMPVYEPAFDFWHPCEGTGQPLGPGPPPGPVQ
jgi:hypothetical protein